MERIRPGETLEFVGRAINSDGSNTPLEIKGEVIARHKGGFYGEVFEVDDQNLGEIIVKTARPSGLIHRWGRMLSWDGRPFPSQVSETAADIDFVSQKIARPLVPAATGVYVPDDYATGHVPNYGQVQAIEKLNGRPPRYSKGFGEYHLLMEKRGAISALGFELGNVNLAGQTHPENIFGLENLLIGEDGGVLLVDQLPGIRHKGSFVGLKLPFLKFQQEIRERLGGGKIVYNEIDTEKHRWAIDNDPRFDQIDKNEVHGYLDLYDHLRSQLDQEIGVGTLDQNIAGFIALGIANESPETIRDWLGIAIKLLANEGVEIVDEASGMIKDSTPFRLITDNDFRRLFFSGLALVEDGYRSGVVSEDEWNSAKSLMWGEDERLSPQQRKKIQNYVSLWAVYLVSSPLFNVLGVAAGVTSEVIRPGEHFLAATITGTIASVLPASFRYLSTKPFTWITGQNTDVIRNIAPIPTIGSLASVPAQMAVNPELADLTGDNWSLTVRGIVAKLSSIAPWGGWGTDLEARWLEALSERQDAIQRLFQVPPFIDND